MRPRCLVLALVLALPTLAAAQVTTGGVRGRLHSAVTGPVANAQLTATSPDLLGERRALSATDGVFQFGLLPPGTYTLRIPDNIFRIISGHLRSSHHSAQTLQNMQPGSLWWREFADGLHGISCGVPDPQDGAGREGGGSSEGRAE